MQANLLYHTKPRKLVIQPRSKRSSFVLVLEMLVGKDRQQAPTGSASNINCTARFQPVSTFNPSEYISLLSTPIYGCLGLMQVGDEPYICVIDDATIVGEIEGSKIYRINNVMFFSLTSDRYDEIVDGGSAFIQQKEFSSINLDNGQDQFETIRHPCYELQKFLSSGSFYFSYDFDLTRRAQERFRSVSESGSFWDSPDDRFFWNKNVIKELLKFRRQLSEQERSLLDLEGILVMAISGCVRLEEVQVLGQKLKCGLISRLSCKRAGTRFNTRGVDDDGNVANSVETEILLINSDFYYSYIITRGSVPIFWEQQGIQLGQHKIQISRSAAATQPAFERHFSDQIERYGYQHVVNLLSQKEGTSELTLSIAFNDHLCQMSLADNAVRMTNFDFHQVVKGNQFENLHILVSQLQDNIRGFKFFLMNMKTKEIICSQQGSFRVNCLDCLDRTNVVQGLICKANMNLFTQASMKLSSETVFSACLNDMWADNGDELSKIYTGTGALKSGFTRTGKRTIAGLMDDAKKTAARFIVNNFQDKSKQEIIDAFLGKFSNQSGIRLFNPVREAVVQSLEARFGEYASRNKIRIHVSTWNVNGKQPLGESISPWLSFPQIKDRPELYVIGFQEIVDLSPQQIMATDNSKRAAWEELLVKTINAHSPGVPYVNLKSGQLVGAALIILVRSDCVAHIRNLQGTVKKTGLAGLAGNKGGVAIRLDYYDSSICFICAHLAAGHSNVDDRNTDYKTINEGLTFSKGRKIQDHDYIIWLGDFNYRIGLSNEEVRDRIDSSDYTYLLRYDQLTNAMQRGQAFQGFSEAPIKFAPTYKYDNGTNQYDTSEKNRIPAWTDRILVSGKSIRYVDYTRTELLSSDHKPVKAFLEMEVSIIDQIKRDTIEQELYKKFSTDANISASQTTLTPPSIFGSSSSLNQQKAAPNSTGAKVGKLLDFDDDFARSATPPSQSSKPKNFNWWEDNIDNTSTAISNSSLSDSDVAAPVKVAPPKPPKPSALAGDSIQSSSQLPPVIAAPPLPPRIINGTSAAPQSYNTSLSVQQPSSFLANAKLGAAAPESQAQKTNWANFDNISTRQALSQQSKQKPALENPFEDPFEDPWAKP